jgi:clan AA aspartic protease
VISGIVTDRHAIVSLTFLLVNGSTFPIEFVIDTGFTDHLCLPPEAVNLLRLPFLYDIPVNLADNSEVSLAVHQATIFWDGQELVIQFTEGGLVTIDEL